MDSEQNKKLDNNALGAAVRNLREAQGLSIKAFAGKLGINRNAVSDFESGYHILKAENFNKAAEILGCKDPEELIKKGIEAGPLDGKKFADSIRFLRLSTNITEQELVDRVGQILGTKHVTKLVEDVQRGKSSVFIKKAVAKAFGYDSAQELVRMVNLGPDIKAASGEWDVKELGAAARNLRLLYRIKTSENMGKRIGASKEEMEAFEAGKQLLPADKLALIPNVLGCHDLKETLTKGLAVGPVDKQKFCDVARFLRIKKGLMYKDMAKLVNDKMGTHYKDGDISNLERDSAYINIYHDFALALGFSNPQEMIDKTIDFDQNKLQRPTRAKKLAVETTDNVVLEEGNHWRSLVNPGSASKGFSR